MEYMDVWMQHSGLFKQFEWISLEEVPDWKDVDTTARLLIQEGFFDREQHQALFHSFDHLKKYLTDDVITKHKDRSKENKTTVEQRWNIFFKSTNDDDVAPLAKIVAYILTIPGIK